MFSNNGRHQEEDEVKTVKIRTVSTFHILAIVGEEEIIKNSKFFSSQSNVAWISVCDSKKENLHIENDFDAILKLKFDDVEYGWSKSTIPISPEQGMEIKNFILRNKDKTFLINCKAGQSRSSAIGLAVEFLLGDFEKWSHFSSAILRHERYSPNYLVLSSILGFEVKNPEDEK